MKDKIFSALRVFVSLGLLGLLFWIKRSELGDISKIIMSCNWSFILIAAVFISINITFLSYRLKIIFVGENIKVSLKQAVQYTLVGYFFNNFMPTAVGGDIVKAHYVGKFSKKKIESYASVIMDRLIGLYTFLVVAAVALLVDKGRLAVDGIKPIVFALVFIGMIGFIIITNKKVLLFFEKIFMQFKMMKIGEKISGIYRIVHDYRNRKDVVLKSFVISIISQCAYFTVIYMFFRSLGVEIHFGNIFLIMPVVTFISMMPSIGGLGVREWAIIAFFSPIAGKETAFSASILVLFGIICISLAGGIVYLWWGLTGVRDKNNSDQ